MKRFIISSIPLLLICCILLVGCKKNEPSFVMPENNGSAFTVLNNNQPNFDDIELKPISFEQFSPLDSLGRCGAATACISQDTMPTEERGNIGQIKPSGWHTIKYDSVDGKYLYNRCHLIGYQLSGENANEKNLITGTRYLNTEGMLPFENSIAQYVKETNHHVYYRVTPVFEGNNLLASGIILEAKSIEDNGKGICFNVFCHNIQPGITIDYATGESCIEVSKLPEPSSTPSNVTATQKDSYVLNRNSKKFHLSSCAHAKTIQEQNREDFTGDRQYVIDAGYEPCKSCNP